MKNLILLMAILVCVAQAEQRVVFDTTIIIKEVITIDTTKVSDTLIIKTTILDTAIIQSVDTLGTIDAVKEEKSKKKKK